MAPRRVKFDEITVSAAYTGELGTGHFLRYKRKSALTRDFYFKRRRIDRSSSKVVSGRGCYISSATKIKDISATGGYYIRATQRLDLMNIQVNEKLTWS